MSGIILPVPEDALRYELGKTSPQIEIEMNASGLTLYQGWAGPRTAMTDTGWVITKYIYGGANPNVPSHYSTLTGVIWSLRATYSFP